jgi:hypothetical protein
LQSLPNEIPLAPAAPVNLQWWGDASTSFVIGVIIGSYWAVWKWAPRFKVGPWQDFDIGWAKAIAVELGQWLALSLGIVGNGKLGGHTLLVRSDNAGIITVTNKGRSRSRKTNKILKHIYVLQVQNHLRLKATHVASCLNISDALSRGAIKEFLKGFPLVNIQASVHLPDHLSDKLTSL